MMGDIADWVNEQERDESGPPEAEDFLDLSDDELKRESSGTRSPKLKGIRKWPNPLTPKQRYALAAWLAK